MNTLAAWVISCPSHVHHQSRGEFLTCLWLWFPSYTVRRATFLSYCSWLQRQLHQCSRTQFSVEAPKPSRPVTASNIRASQSGSWSRTGVGPEVPLDVSYSGQAPTLLHSSDVRLTRAEISDLCSLSHNPQRASLTSESSYCNSTWQGMILKTFFLCSLVLHLPHWPLPTSPFSLPL